MFHQDGPTLGNQYEDDQHLRAHLQRVLTPEAWRTVEPDLRRFGERVVTDVLAMARDAEAHEPELVSYDPWGRRIDHIETSRGWQELDRVSAAEGLVAIAYERPIGAASRVYQLAKLYLFDPSSAIYSCPLAMTDGAARLIEVHGDAELRGRAFKHLTSRDPAQFWTSGQWMTERPGGSDVGRTETVARRAQDGSYELFGDKWFTSATTSQMAMTLARIVDESGHAVAGSRGLSLFYLETRRADGTLNAIRINRLKDKLGTRALPTAELTLDGTKAQLVGAPGEGVKTMATLFNVTRIYNAVCAVGKMRRAVALARDYATRREAFGKKLGEHPLHVESLAAMEIEYRAAFQLVFSIAELLGKVECGEGSVDDAAVLRLLTPLAKLYTAKQGIAVTSEALESFGGAGYVEDTGMPSLLRDAQVLAIWEGTTNVLSLDALRAIEKEGAFAPFVAMIEAKLKKAEHPSLAESVVRVRAAKERLVELARAMQGGERLRTEAGARWFAFGLARTYAAAALLEHAAWAEVTGKDPAAAVAARRWCRAELVPDRAGDVDLPGSSVLALGR